MVLRRPSYSVRRMRFFVINSLLAISRQSSVVGSGTFHMKRPESLITLWGLTPPARDMSDWIIVSFVERKICAYAYSPQKLTLLSLQTSLIVFTRCLKLLALSKKFCRVYNTTWGKDFQHGRDFPAVIFFGASLEFGIFLFSSLSSFLLSLF